MTKWKTITIGTKTKDQLLKEFEKKKINISDYAKNMVNKIDFSTKKETIDLVKLRVSELGLKDYPTTDEIYTKAKELGYNLCPPEVALYLRLKDENQPLGDWYRIAMKQISDRYGYPSVFNLVHHDDGLWLYDSWARSDRRWYPDDECLFRLRKDSQTLKPLDTLDLEILTLRLNGRVYNLDK